MSYHEKAKQLLADLGDTPDTIATALQNLGITGVRGLSHHCPLAHYLQTHIPYARVYDMNAFASAHDGTDGGNVDLTTPQRIFIRNFDGNIYPELVDHHSDFA